MNREELKALGLTDEQINSVMASHGQVVNATKQDLSDVTSERDGLKTTLGERDTQLNALKDVDPEKLKQEIADLQTANDTAKTEYENGLKDLQLSNAINLALTGKVHDEEVASTLINKEKLVIGDDGKIVGLDEQLTSLQESKAYLFKPAEGEGQANKPNFTIGNHQKGSGAITKQQIMQEKDNTKRQNMIKENSHLFQ